MTSWWSKYIGIPFVYGGREGTQCDCWGLVRLVYAQELNVLLPAWSAYAGDHDHTGLRALVTTVMPEFERLEQPEPFAIALFRSVQTVLHVGVMVDTRRILHTTQNREACVQPIDPLLSQLKGFYRPHHDTDRRPH